MRVTSSALLLSKSTCLFLSFSLSLECISSDHTSRNVRPVTSSSVPLSIYLSPSYSIARASHASSELSLSQVEPHGSRVCLIRVSYPVRLPVTSRYFGLPRDFNELIPIGTPSYSHESFLYDTTGVQRSRENPLQKNVSRGST